MFVNAQKIFRWICLQIFQTFSVFGEGFCGFTARVLCGHEHFLDDEAAHGVAHENNRSLAHAGRQEALQYILRPLVWGRKFIFHFDTNPEGPSVRKKSDDLTIYFTLLLVEQKFAYIS
jgi:hypothetical protein